MKSSDADDHAENKEQGDAQAVWESSSEEERIRLLQIINALVVFAVWLKSFEGSLTVVELWAVTVFKDGQSSVLIGKGEPCSDPSVTCIRLHSPAPPLTMFSAMGARSESCDSAMVGAPDGLSVFFRPACKGIFIPENTHLLLIQTKKPSPP